MLHLAQIREAMRKGISGGSPNGDPHTPSPGQASQGWSAEELHDILNEAALMEARQQETSEGSPGVDSNGASPAQPQQDLADGGEFRQDFYTSPLLRSYETFIHSPERLVRHVAELTRMEQTTEEYHTPEQVTREHLRMEQTTREHVMLSFPSPRTDGNASTIRI